MKRNNWLGNFPVDLSVVLGFPMVPIILLTLCLMRLLFLRGAEWITAYCGAVGIAIVGAILLARAKLPLYRKRQFFTFGVRSIPEELRSTYWWGIGLSLTGIGVASLMLIRAFQGKGG